MDNQFRKHLSLPSLLKRVGQYFRKIPDNRQRNSISQADALMSAVAMFELKSPSLLDFEEALSEEAIRKNLETLYEIERVPSDTQMREIIDAIPTDAIRPVFKKVLSAEQRGNVLASYEWHNKTYLVSVDGTGYFSSDKIHCAMCCSKKRTKGGILYYHQMVSGVIVHPEERNVLPIGGEGIIQQDGTTKNDCERNASERLLRDMRREHPHLRITVTEDGLFSNGPHIRLLKELSMNYIIGAKPKDHKKLFEFIEGSERIGEVEHYEIEDAGCTHRFRFMNDVLLNESSPDISVNFLEYWEIRKNKTLHFSWVTDHHLTKNTVYTIMKGGRARWKIENETFNTLKNQGYHFEHNYGHGHRYLSVNLALLMLLTFCIDQIQESCCGLFQQALKRLKRRKRLWGRMRRNFESMLFDSWFAFFHALICPKPMLYDTS